jgi:thiamine-phosphate diphosphorylase
VATNAISLTKRRRTELLHGIYVILNEAPRLPQLARDVLDAGVRVVQYRAKKGIAPENLRALRALTRERDALLVLNDDWRTAIEFDCDGVHLGPGDDGFDDVALVRIALRERLIGLSCATQEEVRVANAAGADYLGVGSVYATSSKDDAGAPIGTDALRAIVDETAVPVAAIGGIGVANVREIRVSGAAMAAVISAVANATDPKNAARALVEAWNH